jgi:uncharacterized membrane protein required for colicin V production
MTSADIVLGLIIGGAFLLGWFWGVVRSLLMFGSWFVVFVITAYLAQPVGDYLERQWTNLSPAYNEMAAFAILYLAGLLLAFILVHVGTRGAQGVTRWPLLDDLAGAILCTATAVLGIAGMIVIFRTFFEGAPEPGAVLGPEWVLNIYTATLDSGIGNWIVQNLIPILGNLLGPVLPQSVRSAMT